MISAPFLVDDSLTDAVTTGDQFTQLLLNRTQIHSEARELASPCIRATSPIRRGVGHTWRTSTQLLSGRRWNW
jgi:hypothetical protein